jgi:hypothetical protein
MERDVRDGPGAGHEVAAPAVCAILLAPGRATPGR